MIRNHAHDYHSDENPKGVSVKSLRLRVPGDVWAVIFLAACFLVYYLPVTLGQRVFSEGDVLWAHFPIRAETTRALAQGSLPLWTPLLQAGNPLFAEGQTAALYPLILFLDLIISPLSAISYVVLFDLIWVSLGMYLFSRACGLRISSSLLAGLALGASGAMTSRISELAWLTPMSWLPWLMFIQVKYWRARYEGRNAYYWFVLGCLSIGLQLLGGAPQVVALSMIAYVPCGLFASVLWRDTAALDRHSFVKAWTGRLGVMVVVMAGSIILGLALSAVQLLPTVELIGWSLRGTDLSKIFFVSYSLVPSAVTQFLSPFTFLGAPDSGNMEYWGYFGILPLMLALVAPVLRRDFRTWFFLLFALGALLFALGGSTPLYDWLYYVPVFNRFRGPTRFLALFLFAATFLAATGFDELQNRVRVVAKKSIPYAILVLLVLVAVGGAVLLDYNVPAAVWLEAWKWLPIGLAASSALVLLFALARRINQQILQVLVLGLTCLDSVMFTAPFLATLAQSTLPSDLAKPPRTVLAMDPREPVARSFVMKYPWVTPASRRAVLWSGLPMAYGRAGILTQYDPFTLNLQRNEDYVQDMSMPMRNLIGLRYYLLPLEFAPPETESPFDDTQPEDGLTLELLRGQPGIPATRVTQLQVVSYTDQTTDLPDGFLAGELVLSLSSGEERVMPIRLGIETGDWAYDAFSSLGKMSHSKPADSVPFPAFLSSVGHEFQGRKYIARYTPDPTGGPVIVNAVGVRSFLPGAGLTVEHVDLIDADGRAVSLASLLHRNDLALAFRSHTAAMWENRDAMPRAFMVHSAKTVKDEQTLAQMKQADFRPDQVVLLSGDQARGGTTDLPPATGKDTVAITDYKAQRVVVKVNAASAGYLVLTDSWYPGWEATVDARSTAIDRADYAFRAVRLPAGEHTVVFEYHPLSFAIGAAISGLSLIICVGLAVFAYRRSKRATSIAPSLGA